MPVDMHMVTLLWEVRSHAAVEIAPDLWQALVSAGGGPLQATMMVVLLSATPVVVGLYGLVAVYSRAVNRSRGGA